MEKVIEHKRAVFQKNKELKEKHEGEIKNN